jgi:hypothetical protein
MDVRQAETEDDLDEVRRLFAAFLTWHRQRHVEDLALIDAYFDGASYQQEIRRPARCVRASRRGAPRVLGRGIGARLCRVEASRRRHV